MAKTKAEGQREAEEFDKLQELRELAPAGFILKIYRQPTTGRGWEWCDDWSGDEIPTEPQLRERFGGGTYKVELRNAGGAFVGQAQLRIAGAPKVDGASGPGPDPTVKYAWDMLREQQKDERARQGARKDVDWPAIITAGAALLTAVGTLASKRDAGGTDVAKLRDIVALGKELTPEPPEPTVAGDGEAGLVGQLVAGVTKLVELWQHQGRAPAAEPGALPAGAEAPPPGATAPAWLAPVAQWVPDLVSLAADDEDPGLYAEVILSQTRRKSPLAYAFLKDKLAGEAGAAIQFQREFLQAIPEAAAYEEWFTELFKEARELLLEAGKPEAPPDAGPLVPSEPATTGPAPVP